MSHVLDALRGYVQLATGLTEVTVGKAREAAAAVIAQGIELAAASREVPGTDSAKAAAGQVQDLADGLLEMSKQNREQLTEMVRTEVDRAAGRMGFVREEELAAVRKHVSRLETQLAEIRADLAGGARPSAAAPAAAASPAPAAAQGGAPAAPVTKPVKKKVPVAKPAETDAP